MYFKGYGIFLLENSWSARSVERPTPFKIHPLTCLTYVHCAVDRRRLTFWHWSGVTPYTSSCEFAGSCVFGKQLLGKLLLQPLLLEASLIPKLRLLFCRVPWRPLTRSPWSTRPDHLCRFAVRIWRILSLGNFLGSVLYLIDGKRIPRCIMIFGIDIQISHRIYLVSFLKPWTQIQ